MVGQAFDVDLTIGQLQRLGLGRIHKVDRLSDGFHAFGHHTKLAEK